MASTDLQYVFATQDTQIDDSARQQIESLISTTILDGDLLLSTREEHSTNGVAGHYYSRGDAVAGQDGVSVSGRSQVLY